MPVTDAITAFLALLPDVFGPGCEERATLGPRE